MAGCSSCKSLDSKLFDPEAVLSCKECWRDGGGDDNEFETLADFEKYLVAEHFDLAEQVLEADRQFLRALPKGTSKKQQARDRLKRLELMTATAGRQTLERRVKRKKEKPVVKLTIFGADDQPAEEYKVDLRKFAHLPEIPKLFPMETEKK